MDGIEATRRIAGRGRRGRAILMLTTFDLDEHVYDALAAGASGFLLKDVDRRAAVRRRAGRGRRGGAARADGHPPADRRVRPAAARRPRARPRCDALTPRETEVLRAHRGGSVQPEIAARLVVGEETVKTHVSRVLRKLGLRDRAQAVMIAYESGLVVPGS